MPFKSPLLWISALCLLSVAPVLAQPTQGAGPIHVTVGKAVRGTVGRTSVRGPDDRPYDCYSIDVPAGRRVVVAVQSAAFDPVIWLARGARCASGAVQGINDNAGPSTRNSELAFTARGGRYLILARGRDANSAGAYTLLVTAPDTGAAAGSVETAETAAPTPVTPAAAPSDRVALMRRQQQQWNDQRAAEARAAADAQRAAAEQAARQRAYDAQMAQQQAENDALLAEEQAEFDAQFDEIDAANRQAASQSLQNIMSGAAASVIQQNADATRDFNQSIAAAQARGQAEFDRRQAAERAAAEAQNRANSQAQSQRIAEAAEQRRLVAEANAQRVAEQQRQERERAAQADADRRSHAEQIRLAEARQQEEQRNAAVEFREGVVLCERPTGGGRQWRCHGPLQLTFAELDTAGANVALGEACGSARSIRDLGTTGGYRAFGCGFGIHPTARDYPGNKDVPAELGVSYVPGRQTFRCRRDVLAYCRGG